MNKQPNQFFNTLMLLACLCFLNACQPSEEKFELCGSGELWPYYHPNLRNEQSFYSIKKHFTNNYKPVLSANNNGIVKIRFNVNCHGESGNFKVENYDLEYENVVLEQKINDQLLQLAKKIEGWIPAKNEDGEEVNSHKFYAIKIMDGRITDILPK